MLWELKDGEVTRFRCRVGHARTEPALLERQTDVIDDALWTALRALEESAALSRQIAARYRESAANRLADRFEAQAAQTGARAALIRDTLMQRGASSTPDETDEPAGSRRAS